VGSQSVIDFSEVRKKRIREALRQGDARSAGAAAIGAFEPSTSYVRNLTSPSVRQASDLLQSLAAELKSSRTPDGIDKVFQRYGVGPEVERPAVKLAAGLQKAWSERILATSAESPSAFATRDALPRTTLDIVSAALPRGQEAADASRREVVKAFRKAPSDRLVSAFARNVLTSLIRTGLTAARGRITRELVEALIPRVREGLATELGQAIVKLARTTPRKKPARKKPGKGAPTGPIPIPTEPIPMPSEEQYIKLSPIIGKPEPGKRPGKRKPRRKSK
jgi:hypothetical protein